MRVVTFALVALLALVHSELWFGKGGVPRMVELAAKLREQKAANEAARERNQQMAAEVRDLKEGLEMVEERARYELGMLKPDEILVQITRSAPQTAGTAPTQRAPQAADRPAGKVARAASGTVGSAPVAAAPGDKRPAGR
jgi:cell division protein FtsB